MKQFFKNIKKKIKKDIKIIGVKKKILQIKSQVVLVNLLCKMAVKKLQKELKDLEYSE